MRFSVRALSALMGAALAVHAIHYDPNFSIGLSHPISENGWDIPHYSSIGVSQVLSDRIIMTPPHPGSQRSAIWSTSVNPYRDWTIDLEFRATGDDRAGGAFHFWYTAQGGDHKGTDSVYTSRPFDGLALLVDKYGAYGGSVRAFVNDGHKDYSIHHNVNALSFAHCDWAYRNNGAPGILTISHSESRGLRVETDGKLCFETKDVTLPTHHHFGVSAASAENPDSFELFSMKLSSPEASAATRIYENHHEEYHRETNQQQQQQQQHHDDSSGHQNEKRHDFDRDSQGRLPHERDFEQFKEEVPDKPASSYKTPEEQFRDLHDRLTALSHHLAAVQMQIGSVYDAADSLKHRFDDFREESRHSRPPRHQIDNIEDKVKELAESLGKMEQTLHSKDYAQHFDSLHNALRDQHSNLLYAVPHSVAHELHERGKGWWRVIYWVLGLGAVAGLGAYGISVRRRAGMNKKFI